MTLDQEDIDELEDILETQLNRLWTKTAIAKCHREGMDVKQTVEKLHNLAEFTNEVIDTLAKMDGYDNQDMAFKINLGLKP